MVGGFLLPKAGAYRQDSTDRFTKAIINVRGMVYNRTMRDEQAEEIIADLQEYYANPEAYSLADLEDIFQDRDPFEFL